MAVALLWGLGATIADADTLTLELYLVRLRDARTLVESARSSPKAQQPTQLNRAAQLLRATASLRLSDGSTISIDDSALAARVAEGDDAGMLAAIGDIDARIRLASSAAGQGARLTGALVDEKLAAVSRPKPAAAPNEPGLLELFIGVAAAAWQLVVRGTLRSADPYVVIAVVGGIGLGIALLVLSILGRGVRERIRRDVLSGDARIGPVEDPSVHRDRADAALAAGRPREALHELYLFALATLAARETIGYDPALTDRELLARAAAIPEIGALRDLVAIHERVWFGLKAPGVDDADRARDLAQRIAA